MKLTPVEEALALLSRHLLIVSSMAHQWCPKGLVRPGEFKVRAYPAAKGWAIHRPLTRGIVCAMRVRQLSADPGCASYDRSECLIGLWANLASGGSTGDRLGRSAAGSSCGSGVPPLCSAISPLCSKVESRRPCSIAQIAA